MTRICAGPAKIGCPAKRGGSGGTALCPMTYALFFAAPRFGNPECRNLSTLFGCDMRWRNAQVSCEQIA